MSEDIKEMESVILKLQEEITNTLHSKKSPLHIAIVMHSCPDPDCIGSACGMKRIINEWFPDIKISLIYGGEISHPQNKTMINVLNLRISNIDDIDLDIRSEKDISSFADLYICVDTIPERSVIPNAEYLLTVDHHKSDTDKSKLKDIRNIGSASTLVWSYMKDIGLELDKDDDGDLNISIALAIGIRTDTGDFISDLVTKLDFEAYQDLTDDTDQKKLAKIINYPIPQYFFELKKRLDYEDHIVSENGVFIGGIGYITPVKRDVLPNIAEERSRMEGVDTCFIVAIVGDNLEVSVRSSGLAIDVDKICKKIFGKEYGGGKMGAGAAKIPMGSFSVRSEDEGTQSEAWDFARRLWFSRILKEMNDHR